MFDDYEPMTCECEQDWSCGLHAGQAPWIDRRFQGLDDEEDRAYRRSFEILWSDL